MGKMDAVVEKVGEEIAEREAAIVRGVCTDGTCTLVVLRVGDGYVVLSGEGVVMIFSDAVHTVEDVAMNVVGYCEERCGELAAKPAVEPLDAERLQRALGAAVLVLIAALSAEAQPWGE